MRRQEKGNVTGFEYHAPCKSPLERYVHLAIVHLVLIDYGNTSMGYGRHTLKMVVEEINNPLAMVDYVTLRSELLSICEFEVGSDIASRFDDQRWPPKSDESLPNVGAIVVGAVGGVVALAVLAACFVFWRRKTRRTNGDMKKVSTSGSASFEPFTMMAPAPQRGRYASLPPAEMGQHAGAGKSTVQGG